jgi:hypothetical protein
MIFHKSALHLPEDLAYRLQLVKPRRRPSPIAVHKQNAHVSRSRLGLNSQDVRAEYAAFPTEVPQRTKTIDRQPLQPQEISTYRSGPSAYAELPETSVGVRHR